MERFIKTHDFGKTVSMDSQTFAELKETNDKLSKENKQLKEALRKCEIISNGEIE